MSESRPTGPIVPKKSHREGCVGFSIKLKCNGWGASARIEASEDITIAQARALAASLMALADAAEANVAAKASSEERRRKWREREISAGRMVVVGHG